MAAVIGQVQEVDAAKEDCPQWLRHSFLANEITGNMKWAVLLIVIGPANTQATSEFNNHAS